MEGPGPDGTLLILQSRPLKIQSPKNLHLLSAPLPGYSLLLDGCEIASQGVGCGPAFHVQVIEDLADLPEGGVLVARHSSPEYGDAAPLQRHHRRGRQRPAATAVLAREFGVPTIVSPDAALERIAAGTEVTDAFTGRVYAGTVQELLSAIRKDEAHMKGTPVYAQLQRIAQHIVPLNLVNPEAPEFRPEGCRTLHDLARFCHEFSYKEMFQISDLASKFHGWSLKLDAPLPMDIHLIDLGNGLAEGAEVRGNAVQVGQIASVPFRALLAGMLNWR